MPRDPSGSYTLPLAPVVTDTPIATTWANPTMDDLAQSMTDSLSRSGKGGMTAVMKLVDTTVGDTALSPALQFNSESNSGIYRAAQFDIRHSLASEDMLRLYQDGIGDRFFQFWDGTAFQDILYSGAPLTTVLANDTFLTADNQAGNGTVNIVKVNTSDQIEFGAVQAIFKGGIVDNNNSSDGAITAYEWTWTSAANPNNFQMGGNIQAFDAFELWDVTNSKLGFRHTQNGGWIFFDNGVAALTVAAPSVTVAANFDLVMNAGNIQLFSHETALLTGSSAFIYSTASAFDGVNGSVVLQSRPTSNTHAYIVTGATPTIGIDVDHLQNVTIPNGDLTVSAGQVTAEKLIATTTGATSSAIQINNDGVGGWSRLSMFNDGAESIRLFASAGGSSLGEIRNLGMNIKTNNVTAIDITNTQNVSIPAGNLTVDGTGNVFNGTLDLYIGTANRAMNFNSTDFNLTLAMQDSAGGVVISTQDAGTLRLDTGGGNTIGSPGAVTGLIISTTQNVTIPNGDLTVIGNDVFIAPASGNNATLNFSSTAGARTASIQTNGSVGRTIWDSNSTASFRQNGVEVFNFTNTSGGSLGLPVGDVDIVAGFLNVAAFSISGASTGTTIQSDANTLSSKTIATSSGHYTFVNSNGIVGSISTENSLTAFNTSSDPRLKSKFREIKPETAYALIEQAHDEQMIGEFDWLKGGQTTWGYNAHKLIDQSDQLGGSEGHGPRDKPLDGLEVTPAGVDQSKRVPLLEAALYGALQRLKELESPVETLPA